MKFTFITPLVFNLIIEPWCFHVFTENRSDATWVNLTFLWIIQPNLFYNNINWIALTFCPLNRFVNSHGKIIIWWFKIRLSCQTFSKQNFMSLLQLANNTNIDIRPPCAVCGRAHFLDPVESLVSTLWIGNVKCVTNQFVTL